VIGIVDYGLGNVQAIANIYSRLGIPATAVSDPSSVEAARALILPGVGSFDWAMRLLEASGMRAALELVVQEKQRPVLGICVGFQMMARSSEEGGLDGLGWLHGHVRRFEGARVPQKMQLPHMGWNDAIGLKQSALLDGLEKPLRFYFLHSYYFVPDCPDDVLLSTDYYGSFCSAAVCGNIMGVQFHPEKSHHWGVGLLRNFAERFAC
jgi:glutamine amidotransferase